MSRILAIALAASCGFLPLLAEPALEIGRAPVLSASLAVSTTWQVEQQQSSGAWSPTGILVGGSGGTATIRLDGFPAKASYRLQRIAEAGTLSPSVSSGRSLIGNQPGASQVVLENSPNLSAWSDLALVYPDASGRYLRVLRESELSPPRAFFRAEIPALPVGDATVFSHAPVPPYNGASGFGPVYDDMPQLFKDGFIGALDPVEYHRGGQNAAAAGECYELAGPFGRTTVIISDTTTAPAGTVTVGRSFFDVGPEALKVLIGGGDGTTGGVTAGVRLVPAPVTGNVKCFIPTASGPFYAEFRPYNYRAGVSKLEIRNNGSSTWLELPRNPTNSFVFSGGGSTPQLLFPLQLRITSRFGEVVSFPAISSLTTNQRYTASTQFTVFPDSALAPVPAHRLRPAYIDAFTKVPGDQWSFGGYSGASITEIDSAAPGYSGSASFRLSGLGGYAGATFSEYPGFPRPEFGVFKFAIRSASALPADSVAIALFGVNSSEGLQAYSALVQLPPLSSTWQAFQIPLQASAAPNTIWGFQVFGRSAGALPNVWMDAVEFEAR